jgi:hypothetical protein
MKDEKTLLERVQAVCLAEGCPEPDEWLAQVMAGVDPRFDASPLYKMVLKLDEENGDSPPDMADWVQLRDLILNDPGYKPVRIEQTVSMRAAERLMDHLYPKLKAVDVTGDAIPRTAEDLKEHEIVELRKAIADKY